MVVLGGQVVSYEQGITVVRVARVACCVRFESFGYRIWGLGFGVLGLGSRVKVVRFRGYGSGPPAKMFGFRV
jgi:hypothetical protein